MTGSGLALVSTSTGKQLGAIRLVDGAAVCEGLAEKIFRSRQRNAREPMPDEQVYEWFAAGWSNGPLAFVPESTAEDVERRYNFRDYWLHGKGATRWVTAEQLAEHLEKFLSTKAAKRIARQWYKDRHGSFPEDVVPG